MRHSKLRPGSGAVSPVISVVLMVAIVVVLAATVGGFVFTFADSIEEPPPTGSFEFTQEQNEQFAPGADSNLTIVYRAGESIDPENVELVFEQEPQNKQDGFVAAVSDAPKSGDTLADIAGVDEDLNDSVTAADSVTIPFVGDNSVRLVFRADSGDSGSIIATHEGTGAVEPRATLAAPDLSPGNSSTHTWTLSNLGYGEVGNSAASGFAEDGDELDSITVSYPPGKSFESTSNTDVTLTMTRTLSGGPSRDEISLNSPDGDDDYGGYTATFDLDGNTQTDVAGPIEVEIDGIENPTRGGQVAFTLDGDAGAKTVTGTLPVSPEVVTDPASAGVSSVHTWIIDKPSVATPANELDEITASYPSDASFDGMNEQDITVTMKRTLSGGEDTDEIPINSGSYTGSRATFDLSGNSDTDVAGALVVRIDGIQNPAPGDYTVEFDLEFDDGTTETVTRQLSIG